MLVWVRSMLELLKPYVRPIRYARRRHQGERLARTPWQHEQAPTGPPPGFIIGCGRSGTTVLGEILSAHPRITYLFEPYHLWAAVDSRTDATNLYHRVDPLMFMGPGHADEAARRRFARTILRQRREGAVLVEKTPHNAMRLGYLDALAPQARFVHLVRDGVEVTQSIDRLATQTPYRVAGRRDLNQWWGEGGVKWRVLARDAAEAGYFPDEIDRLASNAQRGALEWLASELEADRHRESLGDRILDVRFPDLLERPAEVLTRIADHLGADAPEQWLAHGREVLGEPRRYEARTIELPPKMADEFNRFHERYELPGRATASATSPPPTAPALEAPTR